MTFAGFLLFALFAIACIYLGFALYLLFWQARLVYRPARELSATPSQRGLKFDDVNFESQDHLRLHGWYVPCPSARGVILFCHGNTGNISHRLELLEILNRLHYDVFIFDYRGYGKSEGVPSEQGTYLDALAAWHYLINVREKTAAQIVVLGRSLGGAIAARLAAEVGPRALILESSFRSMPLLASELYPYLPINMLTRLKYPTEQALAGVKCPLLVVHSIDDELIPFHHSQHLFDHFRGETKELLRIRGRHDDGFLHSGLRYESGLRDFLHRYAAN